MLLTEINQVDEYLRDVDCKHFKATEFICPCCGKIMVDTLLLDKLCELRKRLGFPLVITSGYRCKKHNKEVGGKRNSEHLFGKAVDVAIKDSYHRYLFLKEAVTLFNRIGIAHNFIHIGVSKEHPQNVAWLY